MRGGALMKLRAAMFAENPLCCMCVAEGVVRQWDELDHIVALHLGGTDDKSNLQGLCIDHHRAKTAHELRELNSPKGTGGK
jgi:5-methylcytosine-specific restriction protein A